MTEQEKREKAIEELAQFMCETGEKSCAECKGEPDVDCGAWNEAVRLYDHYILPKEEEVRKECDKNAYNAWKAMFGLKEKAIREEERKETAREVLNIFADYGIDKLLLESRNYYNVDVIAIVKRICEMFCVEVEE